MPSSLIVFDFQRRAQLKGDARVNDRTTLPPDNGQGARRFTHLRDGLSTPFQLT
jgi:hypothetical protein